jgi:signal transduction histidine kinase
VLVARDITRQTRLEAERAALRERLAQSEKLASLGQFVAGIAHEMNNPLQGVLGHLELLIDMTPEAQPVRKPLKQIYNEADRAAKIVHNLLVFTGSHRMHREAVPIDQILSRALTSRRVALRRAGITVSRRKGDGLPPVYADPLLLQQALLNILINAEHATADAGGRRIAVETSAGPDGMVAVRIHDSGPGIAEEVLPRIFDPFFTTKDVGKGTGLGLALTYGIINEHGGSITAATDPQGGAVFRIELPAADTAVIE